MAAIRRPLDGSHPPWSPMPSQRCMRDLGTDSIPTGYKLMRRLEPGKTGVFSRRQTCQGKSQSPVVRMAGWRNGGKPKSRSPEAHRQGLPRGDYESPGRNDGKRKCGLETTSSEGRAHRRRAKATWDAEI